MRRLSKRMLWWNQLASLTVICALIVLVIGSPIAWPRVFGVFAIVAIAVTEHLWLWGHWRRAELELLWYSEVRRARRRAGRPATISLIAGEDLLCGEAVIISGSGYVIRPERKVRRGRVQIDLPPPASPTWLRASVGEVADDD